MLKSKRKAKTVLMSATDQEKVTKKTKKEISVEPITESLISTILPTLLPKDFDQFMLELGPAAWFHATKTLSLQSAKTLIAMVAKRSNLQCALSVFLSFWEMETEPAVALFELGMGAFVRQSLLSTSSRNMYITYLRIEPNEKHIFAILPRLKHNKHYFCLNKNFEKKDMVKSEERLNLTLLTTEDLFFQKLASAHTCAYLQRWSECFSFSLSALDDYSPSVHSYLHDVFCHIAQSGIKNAISFEWCLQILSLAKNCATSFDQTWKRIIAFQAMLIEQGFFDLEQLVFQSSQECFLFLSDFYQTFLIQHLLAKLAQVEFNLTFQYIRQNFHSDCEEFCQKEPFLEYSFYTTEKLLQQIETLVQNITIKGVKEYFRGYLYLYSTMREVNVLDRSTVQMELAICFFKMARDIMKPSNPLYADLVVILAFLRKNTMSIVSINSHFQKKNTVKYTRGASQFFLRALLISMYWDNVYQPFPIGLMAANARDLENNLSHKQSYKLPLLNAVYDMAKKTMIHLKGDILQDFPNIQMSEERKTFLAQATEFWTKEMEEFSKKPFFCHPEVNAQQTSSKPPNSLALLKQNKLAEQVYAFGYQIVEAWTYEST